MFAAKQIFKHGYPTYFLVTIIGKDYIFFPKIWCYPQTKNERGYFSKKIHGNMIFTSNILKIWSFQKGLRRDMKFFYLLERRYFFSRKHGIFPWTKNERGVIFLKKYTETWHFLIDLPPCKKKIKDDPIPQKYT